MAGTSGPVQTMVWDKVRLRLLDQRQLPARVEMVECETAEAVAEAIRSMVVRGAPAIGAAAAFGLALGARAIQEPTPEAFWHKLQAVADMLAQTRPTAVNLFWAIQRMMDKARRLLPQGVAAVVAGLEAEAEAIAQEDVAVNRMIGQAGAEVIRDGDGVLTICNTGSLATVGYGTALGVIRAAWEQGKQIHVYACETRPVLQGARLTAWELLQEGIPSTLITDNMAGYVMQQGRVQVVIVGADRVVANGDFANKIGTYSLAVLAHAHGIPFYTAAPLSTVDLSIPSGEAIPIEERDPAEVTHVFGTPVAPAGVKVLNPAFDVTPHRYLSGIITEKGIVRPPFEENLRRLKESPQSFPSTL